MQEIEAKILEVNKTLIEAKLKELGAKKTFEGIIDGKFFDYPNEALKKNGEILRLRMQGEKCFLTYKKGDQTKTEVKVAEEIETEVSDFKLMEQILSKVGLIESKKTMTKHRTTYSIGETHFEIEEPIGEYEHIPTFLEIEAPNEEEIYKYAKRLGFEKKQCLAWTGGDVLKHYSGKTL